MSIKRPPYELSLWQDEWDASKSCYVDKKIIVLGDHTDKKVHQAQNVTLTRNVNGTSILTFFMYFKYRDDLTGELVDNPYISMLVNERKIKIKYGKEWNFVTEDWNYEWKDFFIKTAVEDSTKKSITFTCKDAFITELSKNGFALELDAELDNNQGTANELAREVLKDTDWQVAEGSSIQQRLEDYLYEVKVANAFTASDGTVIAKDKRIFIYYTSVSTRSNFLQFLFDPEDKYPVDSTRIVVGEFEHNATVTYSEGTDTVDIFVNGVVVARITSTQSVSTTHKGMRYVRQPQTHLDPLLDKYVTKYDNNGNTVYGYTETEYVAPLSVSNLVTNSKEMVNSAGWYAYNNAETTTFLPSAAPYIEGSDLPIYLKVTLGSGQNRFINTGLSDNRSLFPDGLVKGERLYFRFKYKLGSMTGSQTGLTRLTIVKYNATSKTQITSYGTSTVFTAGDYVTGSIALSASISQSELFGVSEKFGFEFQATTAGTALYLQDMQIFRELRDDSNNLILPEQISVKPSYKTIYYYYEPDDTIKDPADIKYLYKSYTPWSAATIKYDDSYEKIRSITASKSNRFNLIQQIAETFDCWAEFNVEHEEDGRTKLRQATNDIWEPIKTIRFVEFLGQENPLGFKYGINLSSIQRTLVSDQITTKLIVEKNSNEFAKDGFCTIADSKDNLPQEAFLLNFDYFIQHGLLNEAQLLKDLYISVGTNKGYLSSLRDLNKQIKEKQDEIPAIMKAYDQNNYLQQLYTAMHQESITLLNNRVSAILTLTNLDDITEALKIVSADKATDTEKRYYQEYVTYQSNIATAQSILDKVDVALVELEASGDAIDVEVEILVEQKRALDLAFYKKYSRFIQEGSWIDENYNDPDLYYLDAQSVLYNSAYPQVSYTINVIELSVLPEYRHYTYRLGDRTTIEDTEFFGYSNYIEGTPYKEQVVVSEITTNFDDPRSSKIVIQNFQTQFQDLFQRITATTNSLQYNTGAYQRAANVIDENGEINIETLQNSLINNSLIISSAQNESFIQDSNGITAIDLDDPLNVMKLQSKGLFLSTDGGETWTTGVRADGINTQALTAGSILVDKIYIQGSGGNAFRWDEHGINAYSNIATNGRNRYSFVRFDNYGIYGINNDIQEGEFVPEGEAQIWNDAQFGMTWKGFFVKNKYGNGWVEVSSDNDFSVFEGTQENNIQRIKMGNYGTPAAPQYGLVVRDDDGNDRVIVGHIDYKQTEDTSVEDFDTYGLAIKDSNGNLSVYTDDEGKFYGHNVYIGPSIYDTRARLGVIETYPGEDGNVSYSKILSVTGFGVDENGQNMENIALYDNGLAVFRNADIQGNINAITGDIGGLTINENGLNGYGFTIGADGMSFDATTSSDIFNIYTINSEGVRESLFGIHDGELQMTGNGTFTGTIYADSGSFRGEVIAESGSFRGEVYAESGSFRGDVYVTSGYLGGMIITENSMYSGNAMPYNSLAAYSAGTAVWYRDGRFIAKQAIDPETAIPLGEEEWEDYWERDSDYTIADASFSVDSTGAVIANSIVLGTSATIADFLKLGNSYIYNPTVNQNKFIAVEDDTGDEIFSLNNLGVMTIGKDNSMMTIDGKNSVIAGDNWSISPDSAVFSNVSVSGTIRTTVFEKNSVQSIDSALILATSSAVDKYDSTTREVWLKDADDKYLAGDWIIIADNENKVRRQVTSVAVDTVDSTLTVLTLAAADDGFNLTPITVTRLGKDGEFHIGLNASEEGVLNLFAPRALTMIQLKDEESQPEYKVIVGKLNGITEMNQYLPQGSAVDVYGLYTDFAYLKGAIVSETTNEFGDNVYTGLNTLHGVKNVDDLDDESKIVIWAGAAGTSEEDIISAPFKVTEKGYLYARHGIFEGSVMSDSVITNSVIVADSISVSDITKSLHIYDTDSTMIEDNSILRGIIFATGNVDNHTHHVGLDRYGVRLFEIGDEFGIYTDDNSDPILSSSRVASLALANIKGQSENYLSIDSSAIKNKLMTSEGSDSYLSKISFLADGKINFEVNIEDAADASLAVLQDEVHVQRNLKVMQDLTLGSLTESGVKAVYRKVSNGYDLYVEED